MFDGLVDSCGIRLVVAAGEILQWRTEFNLVTAAGQAVVSRGDNASLAHSGNAAGGGDGGGGDTKERYEYRVGDAVVLIRCVPEHFAIAEQTNHLPDIAAGDIAFQVVAAALINQTVDDPIVIGSVNGVEIHQISKQPRSHINAVEVHSQQQDSFAISAGLFNMLHSLDHQALIQIDAVIAEAAGHFQDGLAGADHAAAGEILLLLRG